MLEDKPHNEDRDYSVVSYLSLFLCNFFPMRSLTRLFLSTVPLQLPGYPPLDECAKLIGVAIEDHFPRIIFIYGGYNLLHLYLEPPNLHKFLRALIVRQEKERPSRSVDM